MRGARSSENAEDNSGPASTMSCTAEADMFRAISVRFLGACVALITTLWLAAAAPPIFAQRPPAPPPDEALFTFPPSDIAQVPSMTPLGSINPAGMHVLPKDHMHFAFPHPASGGLDPVPAFGRGAGELAMVMRHPQTGAPPGGFQYTFCIRHNEAVTSYYDRVNELSDRILNHLNSVPNPWINVQGSQAAVLGQLGAPAPLPLAAGEQVGEARSYVHSWDIGVVDRRVRGDFAGHGERRYPNFNDFFRLLGLDLTSPISGNKTLDAVCFVNYLAPALRQAWFNLLQSSPKSCGKTGWDIEG